MVCPLAKLHVNDHPLIVVLPLLMILMAAPKALLF